MDIYCLIDSHDFEEDVRPHSQEIITAIQQWLTESRSSATLLDQLDNVEPQLGFSISTNRKLTLKKPVEFMYSLTKQWPLEFVIGYYDKQQKEDVCYFGKEEGKPDIAEIANYLGLDK
ncbi:MAG: hypothetical protein ACJA0N_002550 [Pseudohongiellaceae bacterium]|jgi:hypothetical protein